MGMLHSGIDKANPMKTPIALVALTIFSIATARAAAPPPLYLICIGSEVHSHEQGKFSAKLASNEFEFDGIALPQAQIDTTRIYARLGPGGGYLDGEYMVTIDRVTSEFSYSRTITTGLPGEIRKIATNEWFDGKCKVATAAF